MKRLVYIAAIVWVLPMLSGCENFLDTKNYTSKDGSTFPLIERDFEQLLTGVYSVLYSSTGNGYGTYFWAAEVAQEYRFGGGGVNDQHFMATGHLMMGNRPEQFKVFWSEHYKGIARANEFINALANPPATLTYSDEIRNQRMGEAKFLRAHFYFQLIQLMGNIPVMTEGPASLNQALQSPEQVHPDKIYALIASDLWNSYNSMPAYKWGDSNFPESGRPTKWSAASLLARVYMFYTGFYEQPSLPLEDGGTLTSAQMAEALKNVIDNSGHDLVDDFRTLWSYTNTETAKDYQYIKENYTDKSLPLPVWIKDGENKEHIFTTKYSTRASWGTDAETGRSNQIALYFGMRQQSGGIKHWPSVFPMGQGWGSGTVSPVLWDEWLAEEPDDIRRKATIWNYQEEQLSRDDGTGNILTGADAYQWGVDRQYEETGFWQKKIMPIRAWGKNPAAGQAVSNLWESFCSTPAYYNRRSEDIALIQATDLIWIRFADVLLMHSELTKTADGLNRVRERVDLPPVSYTEENLRKERKYELAFEGLHWGDIRRWGIAEEALAKKIGVPIRNEGRQTIMKMQSNGGPVQRYKDTRGFFPIPEEEISLAGGRLLQNPGWSQSDDAWFNQWNDN